MIMMRDFQIDNNLYELAFQFKSEKLWDKLRDADLFAVRLPDGEIGYCSVMGMGGEHFALAVYPGDRGIQSFLRLADMDHDDPFDWAEIPASQECLMCSFENKELLSEEELAEVRAYTSSVGKRLRGRNAFPQFTKYRVGRYLWRFETEQDTARMGEALCAALHLSQLIRERGGRFWRSPEEEALEALYARRSLERDSYKQLSLFDSEPADPPAMPKPNAIIARQDGSFSLAQAARVTLPLLERSGDGWSLLTIPYPDEDYDWPKPIFQNEILAEHLRRAKKKGIWECGTMYASVPVQLDDEDREAPYFPLLLISVKHSNGRRIEPLIISETGDPADMVQEFANCLREVGCPKTIRVGDDRCEALLTDLCQKIGVELDAEGPIRYLFEAMEDFLKDDEDDGDNGQTEAESLEELSNMLMSLPDDALRQMPPYLLRDVNRLADEGLLPQALTERLRKLR